MSFYAVKIGRNPGIYTTWSECEAQVKAFSSAKYKKFPTREMAEDFINSNTSTSNSELNEPKAKKRKMNETKTNPTHPQSSSVTLAPSLGTNTGNNTSGNTSSLSQPIILMHDPDNPSKVIVYTDGCAKARSDGAIAGVGVYWGENHPWNVGARWKGVQKNNRAEVGAATLAIARAKSAGLRDLLICTDSKFTIKCATEWGPKWRCNGWKLANGEPVKVKDVVEKMLKLLESGINITWRHVPGHSGIPGNEAADRLANIGAELPLNS